MKYGREEGDWDELVAVGRAFLEERAKLEKTTSYTEMNTVLANRTGQPTFNFEREDERAAMGHLLGRIVDETLGTTGVMLSALVQYLDENTAGPGFFQLAKDRGLLRRGASADEKFEFWASQVKAVYSRHESRR